MIWHLFDYFALFVCFVPILKMCFVFGVLLATYSLVGYSEKSAAAKMIVVAVGSFLVAHPLLLQEAQPLSTSPSQPQP